MLTAHFNVVSHSKVEKKKTPAIEKVSHYCRYKYIGKVNEIKSKGESEKEKRETT